jgi:hypothetical protein
MGDFTAKRAFYQQATATSAAIKQETHRENNHEKERGERKKWVKRCSSVSSGNETLLRNQ